MNTIVYKINVINGLNQIKVNIQIDIHKQIQIKLVNYNIFNQNIFSLIRKNYKKVTI